jgi:hypothetical protein
MQVAYLQANELHTGLEILTLKSWRRITRVNRIRRRVAVTIETGLTMNLPAQQMFRAREVA